MSPVDYDWDKAYATGEYLREWDYRFPSQELVAIVAADLIPRGGTTLDVGCGAGREAVFLAQCGFNSIGVDISQVALDVARQRASEANVHVDWRLGSVLMLPVDDRSVDFTNDRGCFHLIPETGRPRFASEMARVLRPGGRFLLRGRHRADDPEGFIPVTEEIVDRHFRGELWARGAIVPIFMATDSSGLEGNVVVLTRK